MPRTILAVKMTASEGSHFMKKPLIFLFLASVCPLWAKRLPPPFLEPLDDGVYRFVIRENGKPNRAHVYMGGHVVAYLKATGEKLWEKYLYKVQTDPKVEADVQDVFIYKMFLQKPNLVILENERHEWFALDRRTGELADLEETPRQKDDPSVYYNEGDKVEPVLKGDYLIEASDSISYGRQKLSAFDVPTGKLLWEKKINIPKVAGAKQGEGNHIEFLYINQDGLLNVTFWDGSECLLDPKTGEKGRGKSGS